MPPGSPTFVLYRFPMFHHQLQRLPPPPAVAVELVGTAQPVADAATIRNQLVEQVTGMVRWRESIANMAAVGVEEFVELGGKVLGPMVKRIAPDAKVTSIVTIEDIEALARELH